MFSGQLPTDETAILKIVAKSIGCEPEDLKLGGPTEIARGNDSVLALSGNQVSPVCVLNHTSPAVFVSRDKLYAMVSCPSQKTTSEALVK